MCRCRRTASSSRCGVITEGEWENSRRNCQTTDYRHLMTIRDQIQDFTKTWRRIAVGLLCVGCALTSGCKSGASGDTAENAANASKKKSNPAADDGAAVAAKAKGYSGPDPGAADPSAKRASGRGTTSSDSEPEKKETYEGGDPDIFHPPTHSGTPHEKIENTERASTPTPTPNRPIDRPLDPSGNPLNPSTPEG